MNVNVTIEIRFLVSEAQKHFKLAMIWSRAAFSGNTSLIATLSIVVFSVLFYTYTVSKKVSTFKLSVTLSNLNRFLNFLHCWKAYDICYKTV